MNADTIERARAAIERLAAVEREATPGPWAAGWNGDPDADGKDAAAPYGIVAWNNGNVAELAPNPYGHAQDWPAVEANAAAIVALRNAAPVLIELARAVVARMEAEAARAAIADEPLDYEGDELDAQNERLFAVYGAEAAVEEGWRTTVPAALARLAGETAGRPSIVDDAIDDLANGRVTSGSLSDLFASLDDEPGGCIMTEDVSTIPFYGSVIVPYDLTPDAVAELETMLGVSALDEDGKPSRCIIVRAHTTREGERRVAAVWDVVRKGRAS